MADLDREGNFKARLLSYGLSQSKSSKSQGINCRMVLTAIRNSEGEWEDWEQYGQETYGTFWFQGKGGRPNNGVIENMARIFAPWTGDISEFGNGVIGETDCEVTIKMDGEYGLKVGWINPVGGGSRESSIDEASAKKIAAAHGAAFRAIVGNVRRESPKPQAPPPVAAPIANHSSAGEDVPF